MAILIRLVNYLAFYGVWCLCLLVGPGREATWGIAVVLLYLALHLVFISKSPQREAVFIAVLTLLGAVNESMLAVLGVVVYSGAYWGGIAWWTLSLWACFATTYWHAFSWLAQRPFLAGFLGAIVAPMCYGSIESVGGISFPVGEVRGFLTIAAVWAIVLPVTFALSRRIQPKFGS